MTKALLCVPNVSEGRDAAIVEVLAEAIRGSGAVDLFEYSSDPDHNRSVYAYLGEPEAVLEASRRLAREVFSRLNMAAHQGSHPRLGALDVVPFVPLPGATMEEAVELSRRFGRLVGELGVPVYYYAESATRPERASLPEVRRGGYEGLRDRLEAAEWRPDEGPATFHPGAGAVVTGARGALVAFNVNLETEDVEAAREIARGVRDRDGGLPGVRALGIPLATRGLVQVSMNLTDPDRTPLSAAYAAVVGKAATRGIPVHSSELVGAVPISALADAVRAGVRAPGFRLEQVVELHLID